MEHYFSYTTITIPLTGLPPEIHVELINMKGARIHSVSIKEQKESVDIDVSELSVGFYMVKIQLGNDSSIMRKFQKR